MRLLAAAFAGYSSTRMSSPSTSVTSSQEGVHAFSGGSSQARPTGASAGCGRTVEAVAFCRWDDTAADRGDVPQIPTEAFVRSSHSSEHLKAASARVDTSVAKCCDHAPTHRAGLLDIWASCSHESRRVRADGRRAYRDCPCPPKDHSAREDVEAWAPAAIVARARTPETGGILWPLAQPRPNSCDAPLRQRGRAALSPTLLRLTRPAC